MTIPIRHADPDNVAANARTFFITSSITDKRNLLQSDRSAQLFIRVLYEYRSQVKLRLHEFVVMPDHFHVLITINAGMTIERAVQFIKGGFAFRAGKELGFRSPVWQKGFYDERVWNAHGFASMRDYIHDNAVKRGLVSEAADYTYSSASGRYELDPPPQGLRPIELGNLNDRAEALS